MAVFAIVTTERDAEVLALAAIGSDGNALLVEAERVRTGENDKVPGFDGRAVMLAMQIGFQGSS